MRDQRERVGGINEGECGDPGQMLSLVRDVCCHGILRIQHFLSDMVDYGLWMHREDTELRDKKQISARWQKTGLPGQTVI